LNPTSVYFESFPTQIDMIEDGSKAVKVRQVDNNGDHQARISLRADDAFGETAVYTL